MTITRWDVYDTAYRRNVELTQHDHGRYVTYADYSLAVTGLGGAIETLLFELTVCETEARDAVIANARKQVERFRL